MKMGCVSTRPEHEENPRIFRVINVDTSGRHLRRGRLEVTDTQLVFHQRGGGVVIRWPLNCLRRYGFDSEIFSFECGRRCATGSGVYGFKCRRAEALFTMLQESINHPPPPPATNDNTITLVSVPPTSIDRPMHSSSSMPNGILSNTGPTSPTVDESGYLEPITVNSRLLYPANSGRTNNGTVSPGGYVCIHETSQHSEWPALPSSLPRCCSLGACTRISASPSSTHHYVNNEVIDQGSVVQYVNQSVVMAAEQLPHHCCSPTRTCIEQKENTYVNSSVVTLSPGHLPCGSGRCCACPSTCSVDFNTNYAKLDDLLKQEQSTKMHKEQHFYVNVKPDPANSTCSVSGRSSPTDMLIRKATVVSLVSPGSAKMIMSSQCSAGLCSPTMSEAAKEQDEVNYAELDLDTTDAAAISNGGVPSSVSAPNSLHSLTNSPAKSPEGYAQIDFDKTVALSNSANPCPSFNDDSMRKTRHNAVIPYTNASA